MALSTMASARGAAVFLEQVFFQRPGVDTNAHGTAVIPRGP